jgi:peptidoglycan/xylan/chitin deacetylase (PgdA/CDA1 family)
MRSIFVGMKNYFIKTPWILKKLFSSYTWNIDTTEKILYLTFDDGPHPVATPFVLAELKKHNAKATFFCIGKNVAAHPDIYKNIIEGGHRVGNHTHNHLNGWKTKNDIYLDDVAAAAHYITTDLFRPPYGRIRWSQARQLSAAMKVKKAKLIMWDVLSADFDTSISTHRCTENVVRSAQPGSIVVFHDSEKALPLLRDVLPEILKIFSEKGYRFLVLN